MPDPAGRGGPAAARPWLALALLLGLFALAALVPGTAGAQSLSASTSSDRIVLGRWSVVTLSLDQAPTQPVVVNFTTGADRIFDPPEGMIQISDTANHEVSVRLDRYQSNSNTHTEAQGFTTSSPEPAFNGLSAEVDLNYNSNRYYRYWMLEGGGKIFPTSRPTPDVLNGGVITRNVEEEDELRITIRMPSCCSREHSMDYTAAVVSQPDTDVRVMLNSPAMQSIPPGSGLRDVHFEVTVQKTGAAAGSAVIAVSLASDDGAFTSFAQERVVNLRVNVSPKPAAVDLTRPPVTDARSWAELTVSLDVMPPEPVTVSLYANNDDAVFNPSAATIVLQGTDHAAFSVMLQTPAEANVQVTASVFSDNAVFNRIGAVRIVEFTGPIDPVLSVPSSTRPAAWATLTVTYPEDPGSDVVVTVGTESRFIEFGRDPALVTVNSGNYSSGGLIRLRATVFGSRTADITASASSSNAVFNDRAAEVEFATTSPGSPPDWNVRRAGDSAWTTPSALASLTVYAEVAEGGRAAFEFSLDPNWEPASNVRVSATLLAGGDARVQRPPFRVVFTPSNFDSVLSMEVTVGASGIPDGEATLEFSLQTDDGPYALWAGQHGSTVRAVVTVRKSVLRVSEFDSVVAARWSAAEVRLGVPPNADQFIDMEAFVDATDPAVAGMFEVQGLTTFDDGDWSDPVTVSVRYTGPSTGEVRVTLAFELESSCGRSGCTQNPNLSGTTRATVTFRPNDQVFWQIHNDGNRASPYGLRRNRVTLTLGIAEGSSDTFDVILGGNPDAIEDAVFSITENAGGDNRVDIVGGPLEVTVGREEWRRETTFTVPVTVGNSDAAAGAATTLEVRLDSEDLAYQAQADSRGYVSTVVIEVEQGPSEVRFTGPTSFNKVNAAGAGFLSIWLSDPPAVTPVVVSLTTGTSELSFYTIAPGRQPMVVDEPFVEFDGTNFETPQEIGISYRTDIFDPDVEVLLTAVAYVEDSGEDENVRYGGQEQVLTIYAQRLLPPALSMTQPPEQVAGSWVEVEVGTNETVPVVAPVIPARPVTVSVFSGVAQLEFNPPGATAVLDGDSVATVSVRYTEASSGVTVPITVTSFSEGLLRFHGRSDSKNLVVLGQDTSGGGVWIDPDSDSDPFRLRTGTDPDRLTFDVMSGHSEEIAIYTTCSSEEDCRSLAATVMVSVVAGSDPVVEVAPESVVFPNFADDTPMDATVTAIDGADGSATVAFSLISDDGPHRAWHSTNSNTSYLVFNVTPEREVELDYTGEARSGLWLPVRVSLTSDPRDPVTISFATDPAGSPLDFNPPGAVITMVDSAEYGMVSLRWTDFDSVGGGSFDLDATAASGDAAWNGKEATNRVHTSTTNTPRIGLARSGMGGVVHPHTLSHYITVTVTEGASPSFRVFVQEEQPATAGITVSVSVVAGSDSRASLPSGGPLTFAAGDFGDRFLQVDTSSTGADTGRATVAFVQHTDDESFHYTATVNNGQTLFGVVEINPAPAVVASPAGGFTVPSGSETPVSFSLNAPPSSGAVTVTVDIHNVDTVPAGLNLTLNPAAPAELEFDASNYGVPQQVRVFATTDRLDSDVRFELRVTTHATGDAAFDNLELTLEATVVASPISMDQPDNAVAGRWTDVVVALRNAPSDTSNPVTLDFTAGGGANVEFSASPARLVLSSTQSATISVRYAGYLDAAANRNIIATASRAGDAAGENFNGRTASRSVDFQPNSMASWKIEPGVTSTPASVEPSTGHENSLAFELEEGKETAITVSHMGSLTPTADLVISGRVVSGSDGRASMTPSQVVLTPDDFTNGNSAEFDLNLSTTGAADGEATLVFTMATDDGAYSYYGTVHGTMLTAVVTVKQQAPREVNLTLPTRTLIAGYWHVITVSLSTENTHPVTVDVSASPGANVAFNPANGKVQIDDHMIEALLSVRWTDVSDNNRDSMVAINARATSVDGTWNGRTASGDVSADNLAPHIRACYDTTCLRLSRTNATLTVSEGTNLGSFNMEYNDDRYPLPSGASSIIVSIVDGADSRIVLDGGSPREHVYTGTAYQRYQGIEVTRTGSGMDGEGTVAFILVNDDDAYSFVTEQTGSGTLSFKIEVEAVPAAVVTPTDDLSFPAGEDVTLTVQLGSEPSSGMVTVHVDLHQSGSDPALNLFQKPASPADLIFNTSNWNQPQEVTVTGAFVGSADTIDSDVGFEVRMTTETAQDTTFDGYELTIPGSVLASPIAMVQPDAVVAGRWTEVELRLNEAPSDPSNQVTIEVAVDGDAANVEYNVNPPQVVLSDTTPESISVRFAGHLAAAATRRLVATASRGGTDAEGYDGETAARSVEFQPNDMASWKVDPEGDSTPGSLSPRSGQSPTLTMALAEGLQTRLKVGFEGNVEPEANVNVAGRVVPRGDRRVSMTPSSAVMTPMNFTDGTEHDFDVMLSSTGASNGTATIEFAMTSDDGAYHYNGIENGSRLYVVLTVLRNPLVVDEPTEVIAGRWTEVRVSLRDAPLAGVDVMVDLEVLAPHDSDTEFEGGTDSLVLNASDHSKEVSVRFTGFSADDVAVNLRATSSSADAAYDGFTFEREVAFSGNAAAWHVYSGANGASPTDMMRAEVTLKVVETKARPFRLSLAVQPTADVEVAVALLPGGDGRIGAPSPSTHTFTPGGSRTIDVDVMAGTSGSTDGFATLRLQVSSDDAAYSLYAGEHGDEAFVKVEVVDTPIDVTEPPARVAAGRWAVANVALSLEPTSNVTVNLSTAASDVELRPSQLVITPAGFSTGGMVSVRRTANLAADEDVEVSLGTRSGDDDFDVLSTVIAFEFGSNAEMTISVNEPASPSAEGQDIEVEVELGADVEDGSQVVVGASLAAGGDRASLASDRLTFAPGDGMKVFTVNVRETPDTRDPDFDVEVELSIASGTSDGAFALRDDGSSATVAVTDETEGMLSLSFTGALLEFGEGGSATVDVALSVMPNADVNVALALSPSGVADVTPAGPLTFNSGNWRTAQPVVISAADDEIAEGDRDATLEFSLSSTDGNFMAAAGMAEEIDLRVTEDDVAGVSVSPSGPVRMEAGEELGFEVVLTSMPDPAPGNVDVAVALEVDPDVVVPPGLVIRLDPASPALAFNSGNWEVPQAFAVVAEVPPDTEIEIEEDIGFTVTATPSSTAGGYDSLSAVVIEGVVRRGNKGASQHVGRVIESSAAGIGQLAVDVIGEQVAGGGLPQDASAGSLRLTRGGSAAEEPGEAWAGLEHGWRSDFSSLVGRGAGFAMPLGHEGSTQFWARVGYTDYKGTSTFEDEPTEYDGEVFGVVYGIGRRHPGGAVYGLALSHSSSSADLDGDGDLVSADQDAVAVHPYFGTALGGSGRAWIVGSFGRGGVEVGLDDGSSVETDSTTRGVGGGLEARFGGDMNLALRLEGMVGRSELEDSEDFERENIVNEDGTPLSSDHMRLRAEFEASRAVRLESGRTVHPYLLAAVRHDGGDSNDVTGYELGGGMRAAFDEGYVIDLKARVQVGGGDEHREHTVSGRVSYDEGNDRRGLTASVAQSVDDGEGAVKGRVGYGWGTSLFGQGGVVGPSLSYDSGDGDYVLGFGFDSDRLRVIIDGGTDGASARLTYRAR